MLMMALYRLFAKANGLVLLEQVIQGPVAFNQGYGAIVGVGGFAGVDDPSHLGQYLRGSLQPPYVGKVVQVLNLGFNPVFALQSVPHHIKL
jgi:hypothetical protein